MPIRVGTSIAPNPSSHPLHTVFPRVIRTDSVIVVIAWAFAGMRASKVLSAVALASSPPLHGTTATPTARFLSSVPSSFIPIARTCLCGNRQAAILAGRGAVYPLLLSCYSLRRPYRAIRNPLNCNSRSYGSVDRTRRISIWSMSSITRECSSQRARRRHQQLRLLSMSAASDVTVGGRIRRKRDVRTAPETRLPASSTISNAEILREFASAAMTEVGSMNSSSPSDIARMSERERAGEELGKEVVVTDEDRPTGYR